LGGLHEKHAVATWESREPVHSIVRRLLHRHLSSKFVPYIWWRSTWLSLK